MTDRAVQALRALVGDTAKRRHEIAEALGVNERALYQIVRGTPLASGKPRGVRAFCFPPDMRARDFFEEKP